MAVVLFSSENLIATKNDLEILFHGESGSASYRMEVGNHENQRCDRISRFFLHPTIGQFSPRFLRNCTKLTNGDRAPKMEIRSFVATEHARIFQHHGEFMTVL